MGCGSSSVVNADLNRKSDDPEVVAQLRGDDKIWPEEKIGSKNKMSADEIAKENNEDEQRMLETVAENARKIVDSVFGRRIPSFQSYGEVKTEECSSADPKLEDSQHGEEIASTLSSAGSTTRDSDLESIDTEIAKILLTCYKDFSDFDEEDGDTRRNVSEEEHDGTGC